MNVYDEAHSLAKAIRESNEFKEFDRMRKEIEADPDASKMIGELQQLQVQLQTAQMSGTEPDAASLLTLTVTKPLVTSQESIWTMT